MSKVFPDLENFDEEAPIVNISPTTTQETSHHSLPEIKLFDHQKKLKHLSSFNDSKTIHFSAPGNRRRSHYLTCPSNKDNENQDSLFTTPLQSPLITDDNNRANKQNHTVNIDSNETIKTVDLIEFESVEYLCYEADKFVELTVVRKGNILNPITIVWSTINIAAQGMYIPMKGEISFKQNELSKTFQMETQWSYNEFSVESLIDVQLNFKEEEEEVEGELFCDNLYDKKKKDVILGDLRITRVAFLNVDKFPSGVSHLQNENQVILGFIYHNFKLFKSKVIKGIVYKLVPGFTFIMNQMITYYLLKTVTIAYSERINKSNDVIEHESYIYFLGFGYLINFILSFVAESLFIRLRLGGCVGSSLRSMCVDTVIQLTAVEVEEFDVGRVIKTTDNNVDVAIATSWLACFNLSGNIVKIGMMYSFLCYTSIDQANASNTPGIKLLILIPTILIILEVILLLLSFRRGSIKNKMAMEADDVWTSFLAQISCLRQTITNYRKGFAVTDEFETIYKTYSDKSHDANVYTFNIQWLANFIPSLATALVMMLVAIRVVNGEMTIPAFVVFLNTMNQFGPTLSAVFMNIFNINKGYASILKIANLLNSDTRRKSLHRLQKRRKVLIETYKEREDAGQWNEEDIVVNKVSFFFPSKPSQIILEKVSFRIQSGQVIAIGGEPSCGKQCMLKLLARQLIPISGGFIHYPSNWRVRLLDSNTNFFGGDNLQLSNAKRKGRSIWMKTLQESTGTLIYNLKFGCQHNQHLLSKENNEKFEIEIYNLLHLLGLSEHLIGRNVKEFIDGNQAKKYSNIGLNGEKLSQTDRALLNIACALLSSVDLLLISNLLDVLGPKHGSKILFILKTFTQNSILSDNKGGILSHHSDFDHSDFDDIKQLSKQLIKQKTVIFSTKIKSLQNLADNWIYFDNNGNGDPPLSPDLFYSKISP